MNWEAIGAVGEVVGAAGVIASRSAESVRRDTERTRFDMIMGMWMQAKEQDFADVREGILEPEYGVPYQDFMRKIFSCSGGVQWWREHRGWFSASFQREIDELLKSA